MIRSDRRSWPLAIWLALLSGYVDAIGFQQLGGYFVSFMSGNGTMLAVRLVAPHEPVSGAVAVAYASHLSDGTAEDLSYVDALRARLEAGGEAAAVARIIWVPVRWDAGASSRFWVRYLRWAALPWVKLSGTTCPCAFRWSVSSPIADAVCSAASMSPGSRNLYFASA